jgi:hypothetical protein
MKYIQIYKLAGAGVADGGYVNAPHCYVMCTVPILLILKVKLFKLLLQGILSDLFPGIVIPEQDCGVLKEAIITVMQQNVLQPEPCMITKVIQLHDTVLVRHGVMLIGPTGGGKTTVLKV